MPNAKFNCQSKRKLPKKCQTAKHKFPLPNDFLKCQIWLIWHLKMPVGNPGRSLKPEGPKIGAKGRGADMGFLWGATSHQLGGQWFFCVLATEKAIFWTKSVNSEWIDFHAGVSKQIARFFALECRSDPFHFTCAVEPHLYHGLIFPQIPPRRRGPWPHPSQSP